MPSDLEDFQAYLKALVAIELFFHSASKTGKPIHADNRLMYTYENLLSDLELKRGPANVAAVRSGRWSHQEIDGVLSHCHERCVSYLNTEKHTKPKDAYDDFMKKMDRQRRQLYNTIPLFGTIELKPKSPSKQKRGPRFKNSDLLAFDKQLRIRRPNLTDKEVLEEFRKKNPTHSIFECEDPEGSFRAARSRKNKKG